MSCQNSKTQSPHFALLRHRAIYKKKVSKEPMEWGVQKSQPNFLLGKHFVITCYHWTNQWTNPCLVLMFLYSLFIIKWQCFGPRSQHDRSHLITWHMGTCGLWQCVAWELSTHSHMSLCKLPLSVLQWGEMLINITLKNHSTMAMLVKRKHWQF